MGRGEKHGVFWAEKIWELAHFPHYLCTERTLCFGCLKRSDVLSPFSDSHTRVQGTPLPVRVAGAGGSEGLRTPLMCRRRESEVLTLISW